MSSIQLCQRIQKIETFCPIHCTRSSRWKIPHADKSSSEIIDKARRAKIYDGKDGLTLRLRNLSGIIKLAGDSAIIEGSELIEEQHIEMAIDKAKTIEQQAQGRYGSLWRTSTSDYGVKAPTDEGVL